LLADSGADILTLKRHGSWKSNTVAESYVSASKTSKLEIAKKNSANAPGCSTSNSVAASYVSASKTSKLEIAKQNSKNAPGCSSTATALERYLPGESKKCCRLYQSN
jgi:hypothetical protein